MSDHIIQSRGHEIDFRSRTLVMGILNVTPDSFSDGGKYLNPEHAIQRGIELQQEGADIIDIGAESSRPGAEPISVEEEIARLQPVVEALLHEVNVPISIDTYKSKVAAEMLSRGAHMINDISGLRFDRDLKHVIADYGAPVVMMHIKGTPRNMQKNPFYHDLFAEIIEYLQESISLAVEAGIDEDSIIVDPGIGFGKRLEDNYLIIRHLDRLKILGRPILLGPSNKSFIGTVLDVGTDQRFEGTAAAVVMGIRNGADIVRVHEVLRIKRVCRVTDILTGKSSLSD